jgi:hypothetical protein
MRRTWKDGDDAAHVRSLAVARERGTQNKLVLTLAAGGRRADLLLPTPQFECQMHLSMSSRSSVR